MLKMVDILILNPMSLQPIFRCRQTCSRVRELSFCFYFDEQVVHEQVYEHIPPQDLTYILNTILTSYITYISLHYTSHTATNCKK